MSGTNFTRGPVTLSWDGNAIGMPTATAGRRGSFKVSLVIPTATSGPHAITATSRTVAGATSAESSAQFNVTAADAAPSFTTSASTSPVSVRPGSVVNVSVTVRSATAGSFLIDLELYDPPGNTADQTVWSNQSFTAGQSRTYTRSWTVPSTASTGTWTVKVGVFTNDWAKLLHWNNGAATFGVTAATTPTPTPTAPPAPTPTPTLPPTPVPTPPSGALSPLHVEGNLLKNAASQTVQLHGVTRSGTDYACIQGWGFIDGPSDAASLAAIKSWRVNAVRVPMNEDCWLGINGAPAAYSGANYQNFIKSWVNLLTQNGLYAILELHWSAPGTQVANGQQPMPDQDHSPTFWSQVATAFKGNGAVIFEPHNEPYPDNQNDSAAAWRCWRDGGTCSGVPFTAAGMQSLVNAIRATGASNVIALGGVSYANSLSQWLTYKPTDALGNLVASWHVYNFNTCNTISCFDSTVGVVAAQAPVIATEIGVNNCDGAFLNSVMNYLDARSQGYVAWTWTTWGTDCGSIALVSDYQGTPTTYGQIYKNHLAALR